MIRSCLPESKYIETMIWKLKSCADTVTFPCIHSVVHVLHDYAIMDTPIPRPQIPYQTVETSLTRLSTICVLFPTAWPYPIGQGPWEQHPRGRNRLNPEDKPYKKRCTGSIKLQSVWVPTVDVTHWIKAEPTEFNLCCFVVWLAVNFTTVYMS